MNKASREDQILFLQKIKPLLIRNYHLPSVHEEKIKLFAEASRVEMPKSNEDQVLDILADRLQKIEKALVGEQSEDGIRKSKTKDEIVNTLRQHKKLTSTQLGMLVGLSRTRCNEYFRELMKEGRVEGVIVDRQKFYKLVKE